jgi:predicted transposase/invertase (TIGR01784 family)
MSEKLKPTNDLMFKKTFASEQNMGIIRGFVKDLYLIEPDDITVANPYDIELFHRRGLLGIIKPVLRETRTDVTYAVRGAGLSAEMQVLETAFYDRRALYYLCGLYRGAYGIQPKSKGGRGKKKKQNPYETLRPARTLNILDHVYYTDSDAIHRFDMYDRKHGLAYTDGVTGEKLIEMAFFELAKPNVENENQRYWQAYFKGLPIPKEAPGYIHEAAQLLDRANLSKEEYDMYVLSDERQADVDAALMLSHTRGHMEGHMEGKLELAVSLFGLLPDEVIAEKAGISVAKLHELKKQTK